MLDWMPEGAATWAPRVDFINNFISWVALVCTFAISGAMVYFAVKYRRRTENDKTEYITHNATLETVWTVFPTIICIYVFWYGFDLGREMRTPPANPIEINVSGKQWSWAFTYPNGKQSGGELVVPVGKPVRLIMKSTDVNHSFFIPAMRVKEDVIGSIYTYLWFTPTKVGEFPVFCAEYCGGNHSGMLAKLKVVSQDIYDDFVSNRGPKDLSPEAHGRALYASKGCIGCHSLDGSRVVGPSFKGIYGAAHEMEGGAKVTVNENYIRESILNPQAKVVKGYPPVMQAYSLVETDPSGQQQINDKELSAIISFIKTLQ